MFKKYLTLLLFSLVSGALLAQMNAEEAFTLLESDGLVVRVITHKTKLDSLDRMLERELSDSARSKLEKLKKESQEKAEFEIKSQLQIYNDKYTFSKVSFVPDYLFNDFRSGEREMVFFDQNAELSSNRDIGERFVFAYVDYDSYNTIKIRSSEYIEEHAEYRAISGDFPVNLKSGTFYFLKIIFRENLFAARLEDTVGKLSRRLKKISENE